MHTCLLDNAIYPTWMCKPPSFQPANPLMNRKSVCCQQLYITALTEENAPGSIPPTHMWGWVRGWCEIHAISQIQIAVYQAKPAENSPNMFMPDAGTQLKTGAKHLLSNTQCHTIRVKFPSSWVLQCIDLDIPFSTRLQCLSVGSLRAPRLGAEDESSCPTALSLCQLTPSCQTLLSDGHHPVVGPVWRVHEISWHGAMFWSFADSCLEGTHLNRL